MYQHKIKTGKIPPSFQKFSDIGKFANKKGLDLREAYILMSGSKKERGSQVKEQVSKILAPRRDQERQTGLSGVTPKAPATPGGKLTRDQVLQIGKTAQYPDAWMQTMSNGSKELDISKIPPYAAAILEEMR